ncbi:MAG: glucose-6-phosphate dehydrogenase assembly protein OpcA [Opitutaceae bacterium]
MPDIFNALPGIEVPVGAISKSLGKMWSDTAASGKAAPASEDAKATQVNFVLHLGLNTTSPDAVRQFRTAVEFSKRYPSRVVVLCPLGKDAGITEMRAKVYGECHLGKSKSDKRCVEFVMLSYPRNARQFLESQVSICLSTDLPLYYWAHRFSDMSKLADYHYLLTRAQRVLIDSSIAPQGALTYPWPRPDTLRDLVHARLLPVRQSLGQFLSRYSMDALCEGLQAVRLTHDAAHAAEGRVLLHWLQERIGQCGQNHATFSLVAKAGKSGHFALTFTYAGARKKFSWHGDLARGTALFDANFGTGATKLSAAVSLLSPEAALSEAMFF